MNTLKHICFYLMLSFLTFVDSVIAMSAIVIAMSSRLAELGGHFVGHFYVLQAGDILFKELVSHPRKLLV